MPRLLALLAARVGSLLNFAELSRSSTLPQTTLKRYLTLFEATFLVQLVPAWAGNLRKRLVKSPKVMLNDSGLAAHLLGVDVGRLIEDPGLLGQKETSADSRRSRRTQAGDSSAASFFTPAARRFPSGETSMPSP